MHAMKSKLLLVLSFGVFTVLGQGFGKERQTIIGAYEQPDWYTRIKAEFDKSNSLEVLKQCRERSEPPLDGEFCGAVKTCFFGTQSCSNELLHPVTKCQCTGNSPSMEWNCNPVLCPDGLMGKVATDGAAAQMSPTFITDSPAAPVSPTFPTAPALTPTAPSLLLEPIKKSSSGRTVNETLLRADMLIRTTIAENKNLAATYLRLGFHDCVPNGPAGGCDGCINFDNPENKGLEPALEALLPIVAALEDDMVSRADLYAYAALVGCDMSQNNLIFTDRFKVGRKNCETKGTCNGAVENCAVNGPDVVEDFPHPDMVTHDLLDFMRMHFGFNARQTVAIMGAHTIGRALQENFGYDGPDGWVNDRFTLDNEYYKIIVGGNENNTINTNPNVLAESHNWKVRRVENRAFGFNTNFQWIIPNADPNKAELFMFNADMAIVRDLEENIKANGRPECRFRIRKNRCPLAETLPIAGLYRADNTGWLEDFKDALYIMLEKRL